MTLTDTTHPLASLLAVQLSISAMQMMLFSFGAMTLFSLNQSQLWAQACICCAASTLF